VTKSIYSLRVGYGMAMILANLRNWNNLDEATRNLITTQMKAYEDGIWAGIEREDQEGLDCSTGKPCSLGPTANLKLNPPSADDIAQRNKILQDFVLKRWVQRCGAPCAEDWNKTIGAILNVTAR
jgi:hypothetical protein